MDIEAEFANAGIEFDEDENIFSCACCLVELKEPWQVYHHVSSAKHNENVERQMGLDIGGVNVEINGVPLLLDNSCVFPRTLFGAGRVLYDDTIGCIVTPDVTGAVEMHQHHSYTVLELKICSNLPEVQPLASTPPPHLRYFCRLREKKRLPQQLFAVAAKGKSEAGPSIEALRNTKSLRRLAASSGVSVRELAGIKSKARGRPRHAFRARRR